MLNHFETTSDLTYVHVLPNRWRAIYDGSFQGFKVYTDHYLWTLSAYNLNGVGLDPTIQKELRTWFKYVMGLG